jgi:hypothetical protein
MLRKVPRPGSRDVEVSFSPGTREPISKPVGLIADTLNNDVIDHHRGRKHTADSYFVHVSDLMQVNTTRRFCPRQHVISLIEGRADTNYRKVPPGMRLLYTIGHAVQRHITDEFMAISSHRGKIWGNWQCVCGQTTVCNSFKPEPGAGTCIVCGQDPSIYGEVTISWKQYMVKGHPDLCLVWNNVLHIYEIKTIDRQGVDFETMDAPLGDHTLQGSMYYWIMKAIQAEEREALRRHPGAFNPSIPFEIDPFVNYIYADRSNKNLFKRFFYKEFTKRASSFDRIESLLHNAKVLRDGVEKKILPTRLDICNGPNAPRAKACNCALPCFNRRSDRIVPRV